MTDEGEAKVWNAFSFGRAVAIWAKQSATMINNPLTLQRYVIFLNISKITVFFLPTDGIMFPKEENMFHCLSEKHDDPFPKHQFLPFRNNRTIFAAT